MRTSSRNQARIEAWSVCGLALHGAFANQNKQFDLCIIEIMISIGAYTSARSRHNTSLHNIVICDVYKKLSYRREIYRLSTVIMPFKVI